MESESLHAQAAKYWLIWAKTLALGMSQSTGNARPNQTSYARAYREACNDIVQALSAKIEELGA